MKYKDIEDFKKKNPEMVKGKSPEVVKAMYEGARIQELLEGALGDPGSKGFGKVYSERRVKEALEASPELKDSVYDEWITKEEAAEQMAANEEATREMLLNKHGNEMRDLQAQAAELKQKVYDAEKGGKEKIWDTVLDLADGVTKGYASHDECLRAYLAEEKANQLIINTLYFHETMEEDYATVDECLAAALEEDKQHQADVDAIYGAWDKIEDMRREVDEIMRDMKREEAARLEGTPDYSAELERIKADKIAGPVGEAPIEEAPAEEEHVYETLLKEAPVEKKEAVPPVHRPAPRREQTLPFESAPVAKLYMEKMRSIDPDIEFEVMDSEGRQIQAKVRPIDRDYILSEYYAFTGKKAKVDFSEDEKLHLKGRNGAVGDFVRYLDDTGQITLKFFAKLAKKPHVAEVPLGAVEMIEKAKVDYGLQKKTEEMVKVADDLDKIIGENGPEAPKDARPPVGGKAKE